MLQIKLPSVTEKSGMYDYFVLSLKLSFQSTKCGKKCLSASQSVPANQSNTRTYKKLECIITSKVHFNTRQTTAMIANENQQGTKNLSKAPNPFSSYCQLLITNRN